MSSFLLTVTLIQKIPEMCLKKLPCICSNNRRSTVWHCPIAWGLRRLGRVPLFWGWSLKEFPKILSERTTWEVLVTIWPEFYGCFAYVFQIDCWCNCWFMLFFGQERGYDEWFFIGVPLGWHVYCRLFRSFCMKDSVWIRTYDLEVNIVLDCQTAATTKERYGFARRFTDLSRGHPKMP